MRGRQTDLGREAAPLEVRADEALRALDARITELENLNRELDRFARAVAHDLKTPVVTAHGFSRMLIEMRDRLPDAARPLADRITESLGRAHELIDALLDEARRSGMDDPRAEVEVDEVLAWVRGTLSGVIDAAGATVVTAGLPVVWGYQTPLRQLFLNLVSNAIAYAHPGRPAQVHVTANPVAAGWEFTVADNGRGIPEHERDHVFTAGVRIADRRPVSIAGHGLGLAACRAAVARHCGRIWITDNDECPDGGTVVHVFIPQRQT